jgi:glycosyltransferase involved in cell wall biosynthesis
VAPTLLTAPEEQNSGTKQPRANPAIRVLLFAPSVEILGGQAVQAQRLLRELSQDPSLAIDFQPINPTLPGPLRWLHQIKYVRTITTFLFYIPVVLMLVPRYDIIHIFSASYWSYTLWSLTPLLAGRLFGKKTIINYRSGEADDHLTNWRTAIPTLKLAHEIVSPSGYLVDVFARYGMKIRSISNILDKEPFLYRKRRKLRPVFLTNRILEPLYNVGCVLRAFHIVQKKYPEANLTIAHDGICRPQLEALAKELGLRNTRFIGRVPHAKVPELYDAADIYLTSPDLDCLPGSILECFASGLPVVATKAGGIPYILEDGQTGLLVDCNDHEAMAQCCLRLLEDEELVGRLTDRAYKEVSRYDGEPVRRQWSSLYHKLVG